jgi:PKD repeat protein
VKRLLIGLLVTGVLLLSAACGAKLSATTDYMSTGEVGSGRAIPQTTTAGTTKAPPPQITLTIPPTSLGLSAGSPDIDRMIVRTGDISMVVESVQTTIDNITRLANDSKGFVVSSRTWLSGEALNGSISIRVPAGDYESVLKAVRAMAIEVTSENTSSSDVTEEYMDLTARLGNLEATEQQLLQIMSRATTVEDVLKVQAQLSSTREQIESTKARIQYIERTTSTSLLNINLQQSQLFARIQTSRSVIQAGQSVIFSADIAGGFSPYGYEWDFGDGVTSTNATPAHAYNKAGNYTIRLKVTDDRQNTATDTRENYINVLSGWDAGNTVRSAWNGLVILGQVVVNILIWLAFLSPVWIVGGCIWFFIWRRRKNRAARGS